MRDVATYAATAYAGIPILQPKCCCRTVADANVTVVWPDGNENPEADGRGRLAACFTPTANDSAISCAWMRSAPTRAARPLRSARPTPYVANAAPTSNGAPPRKAPALNGVCSAPALARTRVASASARCVASAAAPPTVSHSRLSTDGSRPKLPSVLVNSCPNDGASSFESAGEGDDCNWARAGVAAAANMTNRSVDAPSDRLNLSHLNAPT